jgi:short-subunit dehydrogenase
MGVFRNKTVYLVGGSSGIGLAAAKELARRGADIVVFARGRTRLSNALDDISACREYPRQRMLSVPMDVSCWREVKDGMQKTVAFFGAPDILINCAGRAYPRRFEDIEIEQFEETMQINLMGSIHTVVALLPSMKEKGGIIVNTSSVAGLVGVFGYTDYCASKFGIVGFSEALRSELKPSGIKVQVLCPPDTDTPGYAVENLTKPEEAKKISSAAGVMSAEQVASALIKGLGSDRFLIIPGFDSRLTCFAKRYLPGLVEWVMNRQIASVGKKRGMNT